MKKKRMAFTLVLLYLAYTSIYIARVNLSIVSPKLTERHILDSAQIGILGSCFFIIYAAGRIINGVLGDKRPPWQMLTVGLLITSVSNLLMGCFPAYVIMLFLWSLNAYGQSMLWSSILCVVTSLYEENIAKKKTSVMVSSVAVGNILGILINTFLITRFGASYAFVVPGALTLVFAILICWATKKVSNSVTKKTANHSFLTLLKERELCLMSIPAVMHGVMKENIGLWMAVYIVDTYLVDLTTSSYYILLIPIIGLIGRIVYPFLFKKFHENEYELSMLCFGVCIAASMLLCMGKTQMLISAFALGVIYMVISIINTSFLSIYPLHYLKTGNVSSVSGIMDFSTYLGAGISSAIYGVVIKYMGYLPMFVSWIVISIISIVVLRQINEKHTR